MKQRFSIFLSIVVGLILVGLWLYMVDVGEMFKVLKEIRLAFIFPLGMLFLLAYFLRSLRWKVILSPLQKITVLESFHLCMTNYFVNFLIPVHAGEVIKSVLLKRMKRTPVSQSLLTVYVDKATDLFPVFLLLGAAPFVKAQVKAVIYMVSGILLVVVLVFVFSLFAVAYKKNAFLTWMEKIMFFLPAKLIMKWRNFLNVFIEGISSLPRLSSRLPEIMGLTLLALIVHCGFLWLFFYSLGIDLPLLTVFVGYLLLNASFILPAPPGFSGSLELIFLFIFSYLYGYHKNTVSAVAASSHVFTAVLFSFFGFLSIALIGARLSSLLKMESEKSLGLTVQEK
ncbi:MAG: lysylphosphatidylglycerol synthase transmembrane domain-containing protein [Candidatus Aminicenantes bacterium]